MLRLLILILSCNIVVSVVGEKKIDLIFSHLKELYPHQVLQDSFWNDHEVINLAKNHIVENFASLEQLETLVRFAKDNKHIIFPKHYSRHTAAKRDIEEHLEDDLSGEELTGTKSEYLDSTKQRYPWDDPLPPTDILNLFCVESINAINAYVGFPLTAASYFVDSIPTVSAEMKWKAAFSAVEQLESKARGGCDVNSDCNGDLILFCIPDVAKIASCGIWVANKILLSLMEAVNDLFAFCKIHYDYHVLLANLENVSRQGDEIMMYRKIIAEDLLSNNVLSPIQMLPVKEGGSLELVRDIVAHYFNVIGSDIRVEQKLYVQKALEEAKEAENSKKYKLSLTLLQKAYSVMANAIK